MPGKNKKIFIVEDNKPFLETLSDFLVSKGYDVESLAIGKGAAEKIKATGADLVMLDIVLPDTDGFQICRDIKSDPVTAAVPIMLMTGNETIDIDKGFALGADECIYKPFNLEDVALRIARLLTRKQKIFIVDDDRKIGDMLTLMLTEQKYDVVVFYEGKGVVETAKKERPDLLLLDINLGLPPGGIDICGELKADALTRTIPIIMFTANDDVESVERSFACGADDYIFKPFKVPELLLKVRKYLTYVKNTQ
ncbi:MAG: hypothetical protein A2219_07855 [Elusimicrobia bacterium RIFOXYA2_FULL_50_26]|nr:MAG: hypothetical protein A2219_07855 [Elusimicrobia bacterium RIFOXYA2_FULL_50_26]OGS22357.1 MAG: hypothetical protein A2314_08255 [Elusimicrobia bacterium RIFOXYB2_FULL_50_12]